MDAQRAETYLRLQAEAELRTALGFPRLRTPRERARPAWLRRVLARPIRLVTASGIPRQLPVMRLRARITRHHDDPRAGVRDCVMRIETLAGALAAVGAIPEPTTTSVVTDMQHALAARSLVPPHELRHLMLFARGNPAAGRSPGFVHAVPVGITADCDIDGSPARIYLGSLLSDGQQALLTMQAMFDPALVRHGPGHRPPFMALHSCTAADNLGGSYSVDFSGGGSPGEWAGTFHVNPGLPTTARWLDLTLPGAAPVRIPLDCPPRELPVSVTALDPADAVDRYLDALTAYLLLGEATEHGFVDVAAGLLAAGVVQPDSAALGRLAAVARRYETPLPPPLTAVRPASLPVGWLKLLDRADAADGRTGVVPAAAVLPDIDGMSCAIAQIVSGPRSTVLHVCGRGWPYPRHHGMPGPFRWSARDDLGGRYVGREHGGGYSGTGEAELRLELRPPVSPLARELQVTVTGRTAEASVTFPLDWQDAP